MASWAVVWLRGREGGRLGWGGWEFGLEKVGEREGLKEGRVDGVEAEDDGIVRRMKRRNRRRKREGMISREDWRGRK